MHSLYDINDLIQVWHPPSITLKSSICISKPYVKYPIKQILYVICFDENIHNYFISFPQIPNSIIISNEMLFHDISSL